jgi:hypothetical protein
MSMVYLPEHWLADDRHPWRPTLEEVARAYAPRPIALTEVIRGLLVATQEPEETALWWLLASVPVWTASCAHTANWLRHRRTEDARQQLLTLGALWSCGDELQGLVWRALRVGLSEQMLAQGRQRAQQVLRAYLGCSWLWDPKLAEACS